MGWNVILIRWGERVKCCLLNLQHELVIDGHAALTLHDSSSPGINLSACTLSQTNGHVSGGFESLVQAASRPFSFSTICCRNSYILTLCDAD